MSEVSVVIGTEVSGLELSLAASMLALSQSGRPVVPLLALAPEDADRLRMEMTKAQWWEWNRIEQLRSRAEKRSRQYLASWLVLCLAAFSAYVGYPGYILPIVLTLISVFLWWRTDLLDRQAEQVAQQQRSAFVHDWSYLNERLEAPEMTSEN
jgi:Flp pilus assembly protein TadB